MIKENQRVLNQINVITDGLSVFCTLLLAFWVRFYLLPGGEISVPFREYVILGAVLIPIYLFSYASFGLYESFRRKRLYQELGRLLTVNILDMFLLQSFLFAFKETLDPDHLLPAQHRRPGRKTHSSAHASALLPTEGL